jgi:hypothetical protein
MHFPEVLRMSSIVTICLHTIFNISILQLNFVTVLHALKYNNSSNTMQRLTRYLTDIEDIFTTSGTIGMASTRILCFSEFTTDFF